MADDVFSYSTTRMTTTATTVSTSLDNAWVQHTQIMQRDILEPATQLGDKVAQPLQNNLAVWNQRMLECYDALHTLMGALETGAITMSEQEQSTTQSFQEVQP